MAIYNGIGTCVGVMNDNKNFRRATTRINSDTTRELSFLPGTFSRWSQPQDMTEMMPEPGALADSITEDHLKIPVCILVPTTDRKPE